MADNVTLNSGSGGATLATDDVSGVQFQKVKLDVGGDGATAMLSNSNPVPVSDAGGSLTVDNTVLSVTGGGVESGAQRVTIANDSTGVLSVDDNGGSLTVDGTVAVSGTVTVGAHAVTNAGTFATQVDGSALTSLQLIDNVVVVEDAAHTSGDSGVMPLAVRRDADTSLVSADGDYAPLQVNAAGSLKVAITAGAGSGGTSIADAAAFTRATTSVTPVAGVVETSAPTLTNGNTGAISLTTAGAVRVSVASGGIAAVVEDAASAGGEDGIMVLAVRRDSASSGVSADGDFAALSVDSTGALRVVGSSGTTQYAEDVASAGAESLCLMGAVRRDTAASSSGTDGDYSTINVNSSGRLYTSSTIDTALPAGTNAIGKLSANSGVDIGDIDVTSVLPGTAATNLGKAEDAAHASGDVGVMSLSVRQDTAAALAGTDADYQPLITDANGRLHTITAIAASQTLGTVTTVSTVTNVATIGTSVTPGTAAANLGKAEDAAHASGDTGVMGLTVRSNTAASTSGTDGDYQPLITDTNGRLHVIEPSAATIVTSVQLIDDTIIADDAAFTVGTTKVNMAGFTADETATDSVDEGDAGAARMTLDRKVIVTPYVHAAAGGHTPYQNLDCDETEDDIKTSAGKLFWVHVINLTASKRYIKFYNATAANTTVGSTTPVLTFPIPTVGDTNGAGFTINFGDAGVQFDTAICVAATTGFAVADTGAPGTNDVILNCGYV